MFTFSSVFRLLLSHRKGDLLENISSTKICLSNFKTVCYFRVDIFKCRQVIIYTLNTNLAIIMFKVSVCTTQQTHAQSEL
jgi:hypothetical protein